MKKQFFRVKQLADQTFLRAEKSEVLNQAELTIADQKVEYLRTALNNINKKIATPGIQGSDVDKRMKKTYEYQLGSAFEDELKEMKERDVCQLFCQVIKDAAVIEVQLAKEYAEHDIKVEEMVLLPIQKFLDVEFPNILKQKRNLSKYCLDKDSASSRYNSTKKETLKDDMEEADIKVEQSRDALATEMFGLLSKENEISTYILQMLKLQRGYHESALKNLESIIPQIEQKIGDSSVKRVFGVPLKEHLRVTGKQIAYPLEICITALSDHGLSEEGLFRIAGGMSKVKRLKSSIDSGCFSTLVPEYRDVHILASALKLYLRELPEPLLTYHLHKEWIQVTQYPEPQRLSVVKSIIAKLPQENRDNLAFLLQFLAKLTHHPENKMTSSNIAIVISPNLLWSIDEDAGMNMNMCAAVNMLVELFIKEVNTLFPENVSNLVTPLNLYPEEDALKLVTQHNKLNIEQDHTSSNEAVNSTDSPRPQIRKKKAPSIPVSSKTDQDIFVDKNKASHYPSGSSTLNRPHKIKSDENSLLTAAEPVKSEPKVENLVTVDAEIQVSKAQNDDKSNFLTTATHQVCLAQESNSRPVAAPRSSILDSNTTNLSRHSSLRQSDIMSKSLDDGVIQLRKPEVFAKPEIPARPASLMTKRGSADFDPLLQKTQCSVYSVAHKQQPSIVNIQKHQPGHDNQIAEKERFLGHQPIVPKPRTSIENKFADINCNNNKKPGIPPKSLNIHKSNEKLHLSKSNEKLDATNEKVNGNGNNNPKSISHVRTRSDGNLVDLIHGTNSTQSGAVLITTPPSPRSLNKPTQPPPPPPITVIKLEPDSTDL